MLVEKLHGVETGEMQFGFMCEWGVVDAVLVLTELQGA